MSRFTRIQVANTMIDMGFIPLFYHKDAEVCKQIISACYKGGARVFELTNRGDYAHEIFAEVNKYCASTMPDLILGIGSVLDNATTSLYIQLGANFIVSPLLNHEMAKACNRRKILWIPGCGTVSEISYAEELGAEIVKVFPAAQLGGPKFISAIKGPCPWSSLMPAGGVEPVYDNLEAWFRSGVACVGMGSNLINEKILNEKNYTLLTENVSDIFKMIKEIKSKL